MSPIIVYLQFEKRGAKTKKRKKKRGRNTLVREKRKKKFIPSKTFFSHSSSCLRQNLQKNQLLYVNYLKIVLINRHNVEILGYSNSCTNAQWSIMMGQYVGVDDPATLRPVPQENTVRIRLRRGTGWRHLGRKILKYFENKSYRFFDYLEPKKSLK